MKLLYEGKAKRIYEGEDDSKIIVHFKDDTTAQDGRIKATLENKGICNHQITDEIFVYLNKLGVPTHWLNKINERDHECIKLTMIPLEFIVRNRYAGSASRRLGIAEGLICRSPIYELCYKNDALHDPMINDTHVLALGLLNQSELNECWEMSKRINQYLIDYFNEIGIELIDFKIEFGFNSKHQILLGDEISPDCCRLWDKKTQEKLDKDRFRQKLGGEVEAYQEICHRLNQR